MRNLTTLFVGLFLLACVTASPSVGKDIITDEFVKYINSVQNSWVAAPNPKAVRNFRNGVLKSTERILKPKVFKNIQANLPEEFDARKNWPDCADVIGNIRDQGSCSSGWAAAMVGVISDRICIFSQGQFKVSISLEDLNSCCDLCSVFTGGCNGGYTEFAWSYYRDTGIVTGGGYQSEIGCKPYSLEPCEHYVSSGNRTSCEDIEARTPICDKSCQKPYDRPYEQDLYYASEVYLVTEFLSENNERFIMQEVYDSGPIEVDFEVYPDFLVYQSGIYHQVIGENIGSHSGRLIGWGVDNDTNTKYWLVANSWNEDWGENGYFRIRRGNNEVDIENHAMAGIPQ